MTWDTELGSASLPKSEIIGREEGEREEGGAEGVLNFVVGFLGTADRGLIDAGLAARPGERWGLRRSRFCLQGWAFLSALLLFHLSRQEEKPTVLT